MQFRDLKKQYSVLKKEIDSNMIEVAESSQFINGHWVKELETQLAEYVGVKYCITCASGTDALLMAMMAWNVGKGDAVFVPDFTFFSSGEVVSLVGATPIFVDVDKSTYNISVDSLENAIIKVEEEGKLTPKVVVAVDLFGLPADFYNLRHLADKYGLYILEDGAQGFGGEINGKKACSFGDISTTSFFPAKPLGCYGDGGAVFTNNDDIALLIESIKIHGKGDNKYDNVRIGLNSRLDTIQAAILQVKLKAFKDYELNDVNDAAKLYTTLLSRKIGEKVSLPTIPNGYLSSWAQYTIRVKDADTRDRVQGSLKENGIPSMVYYQKPMHKQEAFGTEKNSVFGYNNTIELCETVLSLPIHPYIRREEIGEVVDAVANELND